MIAPNTTEKYIGTEYSNTKKKNLLRIPRVKISEVMAVTVPSMSIDISTSGEPARGLRELCTKNLVKWKY